MRETRWLGINKLGKSKPAGLRLCGWNSKQKGEGGSQYIVSRRAFGFQKGSGFSGMGRL